MSLRKASSALKLSKTRARRSSTSRLLWVSASTREARVTPFASISPTVLARRSRVVPTSAIRASRSRGARGLQPHDPQRARAGRAGGAPGLLHQRQARRPNARRRVRVQFGGFGPGPTPGPTAIGGPPPAIVSRGNSTASFRRARPRISRRMRERSTGPSNKVRWWHSSWRPPLQ